VDVLTGFGAVVAVLSAGVLLAVLSSRVSERLHVPAPALFLIAAAVCGTVFPGLRSVPVDVDEEIVTVALVFILFDGGMHVGWRRFRAAAGAVVWLGVAGTVVTAVAVAVAGHVLFGFAWPTALLIGTALSPTDPAVVFSVLGRREIIGRSGTILEGESGANDPVGIALMVILLSATGTGVSAFAQGVAEFTLQMTVGVAVGSVGGLGLRRLMRLPLPNEALYPVRVLAAGGIVYGAATVLSGSGFLAVLLAGVLVGDVRAPYKREIEHVSSSVAGLAEIVAFTVLGLTVSLRDVLAAGQLWVGLGLAALLILLIRPLLVGVLILPVRLRWGERAFVLWAGLKGAVPILLGIFIIDAGVSDAARIYAIVFVVVLVSVVTQGGLAPTAARVFGVPMRVVEPEPWALGMRFRDEPDGLHRLVVGPGSVADGTAIADLDIGEYAWISMVSRAGHLVQVRGHTTLKAGDEVLALADTGTDLGRVFDGPQHDDPEPHPPPPGGDPDP
jgi:cell volume regulation protein A